VKHERVLHFWHIMTMIVIMIGVVGSLIFMFNASRNQKSILLLVLFTGWVVLPFIALLATCFIAKNRPVTTRIITYGLSFVISLCSLAGYGGAFSGPDTKNAFMFLVVPFISLILIVASILINRYFVKSQTI